MLEKKQFVNEIKPKVVIYVRVSTDKQEALNQIIQLREYSKKERI